MKGLVFGREPAAWAGLVSSLLVLLVTFGLDISGDLQTAIVGLVLVVGDLVVAFKVKPVTVPVISAVVKAVLVLALALGAPLSDDQIATVMTFTTLLLTFIGIRPQVTPNGGPVVPGEVLAVK